jgi:hypothetical protein
MTIDARQASAMLADVDSMIARVKQSRIYRRSGDIFLVWGALEFFREGLFFVAPAFAQSGWFAIDLVGVALTLWLLRGVFQFGGRFPWRVLGAFALFYGFGYLWADVIGGMGGRQLSAFWPTLFQFGYALAGLWFGFAFLVIGLGAAALTVAAYLWSGDYYWFLLSAINGAALIVAGLWMRRA